MAESVESQSYPILLTSVAVVNYQDRGYFPIARLPALITVQIESTTDRDVGYVAVFSVIDTTGVVVSLQTQDGILRSNSTDEVVSTKLILQEAGVYEVKAFLVSGFDKPDILSAIASSQFEIFTSNVKTPDSAESNQENNTPNDNNTPNAKDIASYTFMVYMVGSDLESFGYFASEDIREMMSVGSSKDVNIIIETGGAANATKDDNRFIDFTTVQRHKILKNEIASLDDLGDISMGSPDTLSDFMVYGIKNFPAKKYVIVLWDDGGGTNGFGVDTVTSDHLNLLELGQAFSDAKNKTGVTYEVIGFDACLMSSIDVITRISEFGSYLVSSEEVEPSWGWDYEAILTNLTQTPGQSGSELGQVIADTYVLHIEAIAGELENYNSIPQMVTLSVIDLSKSDEVDKAFSVFSDEFDKELLSITDAHSFAKSILATERYGIGIGFSSGHMDLDHLSQNVADRFPLLVEEIDTLRRAIDEAVLYSVTRELHPNSSGISVYMAFDHDSANSDSNQYLSGTWRELTLKQIELLQRDGTAPSIEIDYVDQTILGEIVEYDVSTIGITLYKEVIENTAWQIVSHTEDDISAAIENASKALSIRDNFKYPFDNEIISLCNDSDCIPVSLYLYTSGMTKYGMTPVRLEGTDMNSDVALIYEIGDDESYRFIGAWSGMDEYDNASRELRPLVEGDRIYPKSYQTDRRAGEEYNKVIESGVIEVTADFRLAYHDYNSHYLLYVAICDYSGNCSYSQQIGFVS